MSDILAALAGEYPQLYLNPDSDAQETYRRVVLRGEEPETTRLDHYRGSEFDRMETVDTPAGARTFEKAAVASVHLRVF